MRNMLSTSTSTSTSASASAAAGAALLFALCASASEDVLRLATPTAAQVGAIATQFEKEFVAGWGSADAIDALLADDGVIVSVDGTMRRGRATLHEHHAKVFAQRPGMHIEREVKDSEWLSGRVIAIQGKGRRTEGDEYGFTDVLVFEHRRWKLAAAQLSLLPPPPARTPDAAPAPPPPKP